MCYMDCALNILLDIVTVCKQDTMFITVLIPLILDMYLTIFQRIRQKQMPRHLVLVAS